MIGKSTTTSSIISQELAGTLQMACYTPMYNSTTVLMILNRMKGLVVFWYFLPVRQLGVD
jgi:hypothetical protein